MAKNFKNTRIPVANEAADVVDKQPKIKDSVDSVAHTQAEEQPEGEDPTDLIPSSAQELEPESIDVEIPVAEVQNTANIKEKQLYEPSNVT
ncbi:MAG: hypothetical protein Q9204_002884 [Flavoplaca sp. TL-2023a]